MEGRIHKISKMYIPKIAVPVGKERKTNAMSSSQKLLENLGIVSPHGSGTFILQPLAVRALKKLKSIVSQELEKIGAQEISMPSLLSEKIFDVSGRNNFPELFKLKDRHDHPLVLGPTHEEALVSYLSNTQVSYKKLPLKLYQITPKFRDEKKPRFGIMRSREFFMKDLYCFHTSEDALLKIYDQVNDCYHKILRKLNVPYSFVRGSPGQMGGSVSHEFHILASIGEDRVIICQQCSSGKNENFQPDSAENCCDVCGSRDLKLCNGIEVGHSFFLGRRYTEPFKCFYISVNNSLELMEMSSHGIGLSRLLAAGLEALSTNEVLIWPAAIAPYSVCIIPPKAGSKEESASTSVISGLFSDILTPNILNDSVFDDRTEMTIGKRLNEAIQLGYPYIVVIGRGIMDASPKIELLSTASGKNLVISPQDLPRELNLPDSTN